VLLAILLAAGCASVLGLDAERYQDSSAAEAALCTSVCGRCAGLVSPADLWIDTGHCESDCAELLAQQLGAETGLAPLTPCFAATTCVDLLTCLGDTSIRFGDGEGPDAGPCLGDCVGSASGWCQPWQCAVGTRCAPVGSLDAGAGGIDGGLSDGGGGHDAGTADGGTQLVCQ
jgi:hypothetical protein